MLREQRDIYLKLADEALQYTITYERGEERLAFCKIGEQVYSLRLSFSRIDGSLMKRLEGIIEGEGQILTMAVVEKRGDAKELIKAFKAEVERLCVDCDEGMVRALDALDMQIIYKWKKHIQENERMLKERYMESVSRQRKRNPKELASKLEALRREREREELADALQTIFDAFAERVKR